MRNNRFLQSRHWAAVLTTVLGSSLCWMPVGQAQTPGDPPPTNQSDVTNPLSDITTPQSDTYPQDLPEGALTVPNIETQLSLEYARYFGFGTLYGDVTPAGTIAKTLAQLGRKTGSRPALVYVLPTRKGLELVLLLPDFEGLDVARQPTQLASTRVEGLLHSQVEEETDQPQILRKTIPEATLKQLKRVSKTFRREVSNPAKTATTSYLESAQQLYDWMVAPMQSELEANQIDTVVFSMGRGLRSLPIAALHDGQQFLVEQYNLALIPSFSLTDTRYQPVQGSRMLGVGISEATDGQTPLPAVAVEVPTLTDQIWQGQQLLNDEATLANLQSSTRSQDFNIIHLATHGQFRSGRLENSYIQLWNNKLKLNDLRTLSLESNWNTNPTIEMLVLSACQTALGSPDAELGFTGLAVQTGVKTAIGSLWFVSDAGSLGLMAEFYRQLQTSPIRAAALRQAQMGMIGGTINIVEGKLQLPGAEPIALPTGLTAQPNVELSHPYYWSAYTVVGNWN